ncbi:MAG: hypothetical protein R6V31_12285 [Halohasta sp.]
MSTAVGRLDRFPTILWVIAVAFFGVGDLTTTAVGLQFAGVVEAGPVVGPVVNRFGIAGIGVVKLLVFAGSYGLWRAIPAPTVSAFPSGSLSSGWVSRDGTPWSSG